MSAPGTRDQLRTGVGLLGVVTFGAGTAIGVSIFTVLAPAAQVAGSGLLISAVLAATPMVFFAVAYAFLASALPKSGASYEWPRTFIHPQVGFLVSWLRILSNIGALTVLTTVLLSYLNMAISLPVKPTIFIILVAVFGLNYVGVHLAAKVQTVLMLTLLAVLGFFVITGLPVTSHDLVGPLLAKGWPAIFAAVPLMISLFLGIEAAVEIGEEVRDPKKTIPRGITLAIILTAAVYLLVAGTALALLGPEKLAASAAPLLEAAEIPLGKWATFLILGAASVSIFKSLNVLALTFSRALFAMGRSGALPRFLGRIHPRYGTPHVAVVAGFVSAAPGLFMPDSLVFLLLAVNIPTMLKYMACSFCAVKVVQNHPDITAQAGLKLGKKTVTFVGYGGVLLAAGIIIAGLGADWRPYALVLCWLLAGILYWIIWGAKSSGQLSDETEDLV
ncbi:APC family permease [Kordiimonas pumila]|uniref:APC family permease n=1 Tax=Kordiimonas pumila TaxID=2161677 RepID=A0ABV7D3X7_9PROT|nr:APC family permease [Kordiimonas pumila]